jgi:SAM-dependent methyltransferase
VLRQTVSRVSLRSRERKLRLFLELYRPGPETTVVDVGVTDAPFGAGSTDNFFEALYPWPQRITAVGRTELDRFAAAFPAVRAVRADGRRLPFADGEFDLGFSNAVVEHVEGGRAAQRQFVRELCRVAGRVFVTTPNRWFPVDPHTLLPVVHWLPAGPARARLLRARGFDDVLDPLGPRELASLFPYPVRVHNRGLTLVAVGPV